MSKNLKRISIIAMFMFCVLLFSGCGTIQYTFSENMDGSLAENYTFTFSQTELSTAGATESQINRIEDSMKKYLGVDVLFLSTSLKTRLINDYQDRVNTNSELTQQEKTELLNSLEITFTTNSHGEYYFDIKYANIKSYYYFYQITEEDLEEAGNDYVYEYDFLTYNSIQETKTKFGAIYRDNKILGEVIWEEVYDIVKTNSNATVANALTQPNFSYRYQTTSARLHSDCDKLYTSGDYYVHEWTLSSTETARVIHFYNTEARRVIWYALLLGSTLILIGVLYFINIIKKSQTKKK